MSKAESEGTPRVATEEERRRSLAAFLVGQRSRIPAEALTLGPYLRMRERHGMPVDAAEIAHAIGVNAHWYALLEQGAPTRPSTLVIDRLERALALGAAETETLWNLAIPPPRTEPREESRLVHEAFSSLQWYLRKLNAASSVDEVLTIAEESACAHFPNASFIIAMSRTSGGRWVPHGEGVGTPRALRRVWLQYGEIHRPLAALDRSGLDLLMGYPVLSQPGDLLTFGDLDRSSLTAVLKGAYQRYERNNGAELLARMRSREGYVGHLFFADFCKSYGDPVDRELVATIADFASLALA
jgi:transcriptional regulator with XRE-family HTH domain